MYTLLALGLGLAVGFGLIFLAFRLSQISERLLVTLTRRVRGKVRWAIFEPALRGGDKSMAWFRAWAVLTAALVLFLILRSAAWHSGDPRVIPAACVDAALGIAWGTFLIFLAKACVSFFPRARGYHLLSRSGIQALWAVEPGQSPDLLCDGLAGRMASSQRLGILDVTGYEWIGKGPGAAGGILYDTLSMKTSVPVHLLLLEPESQALDPQERHATVSQTVLAEMDVSLATYQRQVRATLDAIATLNEQRPEDAKIKVAFYNEKPAFRLILFDDSVLVSPWVPKEQGEPVSSIDVSRRSPTPSLHEGFRYHFARLWGLSCPGEKEAEKPKSAAVRKDSGSVAVRKDTGSAGVRKAPPVAMELVSPG